MAGLPQTEHEALFWLTLSAEVDDQSSMDGWLFTPGLSPKGTLKEAPRPIVKGLGVVMMNNHLLSVLSVLCVSDTSLQP